jgi:hypothetical protein
MGIRYSYDDFTTKGHGVIEWLWGKKKYHHNVIEAQKVGNLPPNVKVKQISKNYYSLKIPGRSFNGSVMKEIKQQIDSGVTVKINDTTFLRKNSNKEYELLKKSKSSKSKAGFNTINPRNNVDDAYNHLMEIHKKANPGK